MEKSKVINIAVFASGFGSNARNIFEYVANQSTQTEYQINVSCLICDQTEANVINIAKQFDIPVHVVLKKNKRSEHENEILEVLSSYNIDYICLCGYMKILSPDFINQYSDEHHSRIINIHPSLLPNYKGLNSYQRAFDENETLNGVTLHYVDDGVDTGPIIFQKKFSRFESDTFGDFKQRGMNCEYEIYREFLSIIKDKGRVDYVSL